MTNMPKADKMTPAPVPEVNSLDKLFKTVFRVFLRELLEMLHPELAALLAFEKVSFVAEPAFADFRKAGHVEPDIVAQLETYLGNAEMAIVHIESEAEFSSEMEERMRHYFMQLELKYNLPVIAAVVYLKGGPPGVMAHEVVRQVGPWKCGSFCYLSLGLSGCVAEEWVGRPQLLAGALAALMSSRQWDPVEKKLSCLRAIVAEQDLSRRFLLNKVIDVCLQLKEDERARFEAALDQEADTVKTMAITWEEALAESESRGEARGEARGIAIGQDRGKVEATRQAIELMVSHRFGKLPTWAKERLDAEKELSRLYQILEALLEVHTLAQLEVALGIFPGSHTLPS